MSIVEKAAERLKALQPQATDTDAPIEDPRAAQADAPVAPDEGASSHETRQLEPAPAAARAAKASSRPARPVLEVDPLRLVHSGLLPLEKKSERRLADELRRVKRPLLNNTSRKRQSPLEHARRIMVTSAIPGEGKSFTSLNLAMSLAREPDFEVLLIDGDVPKANISDVFGLADRPGLMDLLLDEKRQAEELVVHTNLSGLMVLPAGKHHALTSELFGGQRMQQVLAALDGGSRKRLLVFDSSPLLATSEAPALASHVGQVLMVVAAGRTRQQELASAFENLGEHQFVGLLLNKSRLPASENHYYGEYYGDGNSVAKPEGA